MVTTIWLNNSWRNIKPYDFINNTRAVQSFCTANCLKNNLFKSQGGWYLINFDGKLEFLTRTLQSLTFEELYNKVKKD